jgi:hypothetical protein
MNDETTNADEEILTYTASDEALEAAAGTARGATTQWRDWAGGTTICFG